MKITKDQLKEMIKDHLNEAFADFAVKGDPVQEQREDVVKKINVILLDEEQFGVITREEVKEIRAAVLKILRSKGTRI